MYYIKLINIVLRNNIDRISILIDSLFYSHFNVRYLPNFYAPQCDYLFIGEMENSPHSSTLSEMPKGHEF